MARIVALLFAGGIDGSVALVTFGVGGAPGRNQIKRLVLRFIPQSSCVTDSDEARDANSTNMG